MYSWFERTINGLRTGTDCSFVNPHNPCDIRWIWLYCQSLAETGFARLSRTKWRTIEHPTLGLVQWRMCVDRFGDTSFKLKVGGEMVIRTVKGGDGRTYAKWSICGWHLSDPMVVDAYDDFLGTIEDDSLLPRPKDFHTA